MNYLNALKDLNIRQPIVPVCVERKFPGLIRNWITFVNKIFERIQYRHWIRKELDRQGGLEYFRALEDDIGAPRDYFLKESKKGVFEA